jgi:hypothetical protein
MENAQPLIMKSRRLTVTAVLLGILVFRSTSASAEVDPMACLREIQGVCAHLEDQLETCLTDRGDQLSTPCRDQLKTAMSVMKDPTGPASCVPDVQRLCPNLESKALGQCITDQQGNFSESCRAYLQSANQKAAGATN